MTSNVVKFTNIINLSVSVHLSVHIAVTAAPRFFYPVDSLPITRRFWPAWTCTFSAAFLLIFSRKLGGCEERLIGPLDEVDRLVGINLGSVYLRRDDAARGANLRRHCYSWWPSYIRSNLKGATCCCRSKWLTRTRQTAVVGLWWPAVLVARTSAGFLVRAEMATP